MSLRMKSSNCSETYATTNKDYAPLLSQDKLGQQLSQTLM